ncbi:MAG: hypothetical protein ACLURV_13450 [Gallintestinimicrobium sp.]
MILSDGVGSGESAARDSGRIVDLTERILDAGLGPDMAMLLNGMAGAEGTKTGWRRLICAGLIFTGGVRDGESWRGSRVYQAQRPCGENSEQAAAARHVGVRGHQ